MTQMRRKWLCGRSGYVAACGKLTLSPVGEQHRGGARSAATMCAGPRAVITSVQDYY